jgi:NTP pyrophosphatase (non-canonical NTP hydrolase)
MTKDPALDAYRNLPRDLRQKMIADWAIAAFGREEATGLPQRGLRLLEEAIEAFQACGGDEAIAHKLVAYVFARPPGMIGQELGGVAVTVLALAAAAGLLADEEECREVHRVLSKPIREFTDRNANKNAAGFKIESPRRNSCCGNVGTHGESGREYCSTCGQEIA